ncbi:MAG: hemolysin family protein [Thermoguttaceae bacterium]
MTVLVVTLVILFLISWVSSALALFSRHDLETLCERDGKLDTLSEILKEHQCVAQSIQTLTVIAAAAATAALTLVFVNKVASPTDGVLAWLVMASAVLVGVVIPLWIVPPLARLTAVPIVYYGWRFWFLLAFAAVPLTMAGAFVAAVIYRLAGVPDIESEEEAFEEEIRTIVTEGHREGHLEDDARVMIEGVIELSEATVSEIMTPRTDMKSIPNSLSWDEMLAEVVAVGHSRIPVYRDNRDDIIGILIAKDILTVLSRDDAAERRPWTSLLKDPLYVPETKPVNQLLQDFLNSNALAPESGRGEQSRSRRHSHLAIVLDEYGGVSGIVTLEDILEEIVGEIVDEHDPVVSAAEIVPLESGGFSVLGRTHMDEVNEKTGLALPEDDDFDTVAGYIFSTLGRIPKVGEVIELESAEQHFSVTILEATPRRIERVIIERVAEPNG